MKKFYLLILVSCIATALYAQAFYNITFNSGMFPAGWVPNDSRIFLSNTSASSGYTSSSTSPEASGGYNVLCQHCAPNGSTITLMVSGVISTVGRTNIRVGFGRRATAAWDRPVALDWSSDGANWNAVNSDVSSGATTIWDVVYFDLPGGAENVSNLRFRFTYTTTTNNNCTTPPNFRIDDFTVGSNFTLPVELRDFQARAIQRQALLQWSTASETNNHYFAVERSADGVGYEEIGRLSGAGTSRTIRNYDFWDNAPLTGANYYRLRQVDYDGQPAFSAVRRVEFHLNTPFRVFPSPAFVQIQLAWTASPPATDMDWGIYDTAGRCQRQGKCPAGSPGLEIPVHQLPPGIYLLRLTGDRQVWFHTFVKQ
ncbi:MAG: T9SS type A sorting domain-containing protein [Saprospirales bacterium]|nr:T9SS type A sorting domain-containing protein [Saprospirales bacterium]